MVEKLKGLGSGIEITEEVDSDSRFFCYHNYLFSGKIYLFITFSVKKKIVLRILSVAKTYLHNCLNTVMFMH